MSFPPQPQWQTIAPGDARELFRHVFCRWGLPGGLRVDNGHPWGLNSGLPPDLALWLLGLGLTLSWIPPRQPQYNGKVERCNGVSQQWAEPTRCGNRAQLQEQLDRECRNQRERYPSVAGRTRLEAFPGLSRIAQPYDPDQEEPLWELSYVDRFLADLVLHRRANARGAIWLYGQGRVVGRRHQGKEVDIRFDMNTRHWIVVDPQGQELKRLPALELTRERILSLSVGAKRPHRKNSEKRG